MYCNIISLEFYMYVYLYIWLYGYIFNRFCNLFVLIFRVSPAAPNDPPSPSHTHHSKFLHERRKDHRRDEAVCL